VRAVEGLEALVDRLVGRWTRDDLTPGEPGVDTLSAEPSQVLRGLVRAAVVLVVLQTLVHLVNAAAFDLRIDRLDADRDGSVWSWAGSAAELTSALGAGLLLVVAPARYRALAFLALVFTFLSMDDTVQVHERLSHILDRFGTPIPRRMVWPIIYAPLMLAAYVLLWRVSGAMVDRCRRAVRSGLVMLGLSIVLEFAVSTLLIQLGYHRVAEDTRTGSMVYELEVVVEEALELAGWLLIGAALVATGLELLMQRVRRSAGTAGTSTPRSSQLEDR
jgi:hypothetical protein